MKRLLIANRGEIAVRIIRTAKRLGIETVAVCSEADVGSPFTTIADQTVVIGPAPAGRSYLNQEAILEAARASGADGIHPGFGFLSENADFAEAVLRAGLIWVGPTPATIRLMGDKIAALKVAKAAGVPVLSGTEGAITDVNSYEKIIEEIGLPLVIKASAGGGGRGIRVVRDESSFVAILDQARAEAQTSFDDSTVYLERFVEHARHVEVQIVGDGENVVHIGDRDCSMQRRSQKVLEEAPAPDLPHHVRETIRQSSVQLALDCKYEGVGTVEFLYDPVREEAAFIEMNTRLQVEHAVTELVTGIDLVELQIRIAEGNALELTQDEINISGHAFECRINAEDPSNNFFPSPGVISKLHWPEGEGVRVDSGVEEGTEVVPYYDSMIAKIIVHGRTREEALSRLKSALDLSVIEGISTTIPLHRLLASRVELEEVSHFTTFIESQPGLLPDLETV